MTDQLTHVTVPRQIPFEKVVPILGWDDEKKGVERLKRMSAAGRFPGKRIMNGRWCVGAEELIHWLEGCKVQPPEEASPFQD